MRSNAPEILRQKDQLHHELQRKYREFFESELAITLLENSQQFHAVRMVSSAIVRLMALNESAVMELIARDARISEELKEPNFGSCYHCKQEPTAAEVFKKMCSILQEEHADISAVMQIHGIFIYRIYPHLDKRSEKEELTSVLFTSSLFDKENRNRTEIEAEKVKSTTLLGISNHPVFSRKLKKSSKHHLRALEKYAPDYNSGFFKSALKKNIPVVCGPSGHTRSLINGAKLYGNLTGDQLQEYALFTFAFLAAGGNHSFHEVMAVAALAGVAFEEGNYAQSFPLSVRQSAMFQTLARKYPEFLDPDIAEEYSHTPAP